jgi:phosphoribosylformylglycinamidine synthase
MKSRGVESAIIGEFTDSGRCVVKYNNREVMNIDLDFLHHGLPKRELKSEKSGLLPADPPFLKEKGGIYTKILEEMLENKNLCGFSFISEQYDHEVQGGSVLKPLCGRGRINTEAQVFRPLLSSKKGVVLSASLYPSYGDISSYAMTACALDTAVRNIICAGGALSHLAVLDNFCWCSSYDKNRLAQLKSSVKACYDSGVGFGTPFISGKDSMFNDFKGYDEKGKPVSISIPPTLLISALSVIPDVEKVISPEFKNAGDFIFLLGETKDELGASEYYKLLAQKSKKEKNIGSEAPVVNPEKNLKIYKVVERLIDQQILHSALSLASGGLAIALAKASIGGMIGCAISLKNISGEAFSADSLLFSESQGRILVSLPREKIFKFKRMAKEIPWTQLGQVIKKPDLTILDRNDRKIVNAPVKKLHKIYHQFSERMK